MEQIGGAIDARAASGETLDNRLIRIEDATIRSAELDGQIARIDGQFRNRLQGPGQKLLTSRRGNGEQDRDRECQGSR